MLIDFPPRPLLPLAVAHPAIVPEATPEYFCSLLSSLLDDKRRPWLILTHLHQIRVKHDFEIPSETLEPLLIIIDPDSPFADEQYPIVVRDRPFADEEYIVDPHSPFADEEYPIVDPDSPFADEEFPLVRAAFRVILDLIRTPLNENLPFFADPRSVELIWFWATAQLESAHLCLLEIIDRNPSVLEFLKDHRLLEELRDHMSNPTDQGVQLVTACLRHEPGLFTVEQIGDFFVNLCQFLLNCEDDNLVDAAFNFLLQVIEVSSDFMPIIVEFLAGWQFTRLDDVWIGVVLKILEHAITATESFEVLAHEQIVELFVRFLGRSSPWSSHILALLLLDFDIAPLLPVEPLIEAVVNVLIQPKKFNERVQALRFTLRVFEQFGSSLRDQLLDGGLLEAIAVLATTLAEGDLRMSLAALLDRKERQPGWEMEIELVEALDEVAQAGDAEIAQVVAALLD
jgi:hypothetical protein